MIRIIKNKKTPPRRKAPLRSSAPQRSSAGKKNPRPTPGKLSGFIFISFAIFTFLSLLSYPSASGSIGKAAYYSSGVFDIFPNTFGNLTGTIGALVAGIITTLFGTAGYMLPFTALQTGIRRLRGNIRVERKTSRLNPFLFLVMLSALFFVLSGQDPYAGGISGELITGVLSTYFNGSGALLIIFATLVTLTMKMTNASMIPLFSRSGIILKSRLKKNFKGPAISTDLKKQSKGGFLKSNAITPDSLPPLSLLKTPDLGDQEEIKRDLLMKASILEERLRGFGVEGKVTAIHHGPVITRYEFHPAPGIRVTRILNLADDLALGLKASSLRVVTPVPGESAVGIEIPNETRQVVYLKEVIGSPEFARRSSKLSLALGKDIGGRPFTADLIGMPHLLIAGATGSGKSVCLNALICSLLFKATSEEVKFIFIDPKRLELGIYTGLPHLLRPIITEANEALEALNRILEEMENRYKLLAQWEVRNLAQYNALFQGTTRRDGKPLPYIVVVVDELADLMLVSSRRVEKPIVRIAQMARAVGIHMIVATQRPSVNVITGLIKANFPARIAFRTASQIDSRTIIDSKGAESLIGNGDMLFLAPGATRLERIHGAFVSEEEIHRVMKYLNR
jgi:S-DNA-T family DNA segregation ATPase FtsK/SpoIIIE